MYKLNTREFSCTYIDGFSSHNHKLLRTLHEKPREFLAQNLFNLVRLLDFDGHAHGVNGGLDEAHLLVGSRDDQRLQQQLLIESKHKSHISQKEARQKHTSRM
jgi:hypothetical protein